MESKIFARLTAWQNWIFQRPNAIGEDGALKRYGTGQKPVFDTQESADRGVRSGTSAMNIENVDYTTKIPNNVDLAEDRQVLRALESWHPGYIDWWKDMGPEGFQEALVYLRTAVSVDPKGWAKFDYVNMPDYRWGILLAPQEEGRKIPFGRHYGEPAWQDVPGEYRAMLRRLIVIQGDTEPASVEQQRHLGKTAPSLYDMRNVFQVNVEEGRHLWAMVYLLQKYFGRDGREEADELLQRRSGDADKPRMLGAFNEATPDWLSFLMFTFFTDRDGKMQLESLAQSGFDPLSRTCRFMLTEEAHHMFVGETGVGRTIQRTCEAMQGSRHRRPERHREGARARRHRPADDAEEAQSALLAVARSVRLRGLDQRRQRLQRRPQGPLPGDQDRRRSPARTCDLSGAQIRRRRDQARRRAGADRAQHAAARRLHRRLPARRRPLEQDHRQDRRRVPARAAACRLPPPDRRIQGRASVAGRRRSSTRRPGTATQSKWLPSKDDGDFIGSLMQPVTEPGQFASWIAPPRIGIDNKPGDFEYVKIAA